MTNPRARPFRVVDKPVVAQVATTMAEAEVLRLLQKGQTETGEKSRLRAEVKEAVVRAQDLGRARQTREVPAARDLRKYIIRRRLWLYVKTQQDNIIKFF